MKCFQNLSKFLSSIFNLQKHIIKKHKKTWGDMTTHEEPKIIALYKMFPDLQDSTYLGR